MSENKHVTLLSAKVRALAALLIGIVAGIVGGVGVGWAFSPMIGWDVAALFYAVWTWRAILPLSAEQTAHLALREDPGRATTDGLLVVASVISLIGVGLLIVEAGKIDGGWVPVVIAAFGIASVVASWLLVHTIFALRYARLYYSHPEGGVNFNENERPSYIDFAYLAFTIGMTFQVSDTNLSHRTIRATALRHAALSYVFGTVIVATTINLIAGLGK